MQMIERKLTEEEWGWIEERRAARRRITIAAPDHLVKVLRGHPDRYVYEAAKGGYFITYQGGSVSRAIIDEAVDRGLIHLRYPDKTLNAWSLA